MTAPPKAPDDVVLIAAEGDRVIADARIMDGAITAYLSAKNILRNLAVG
jgi:hypothetical protein